MNATEQVNKISQQLMSKNYKLTKQREATVRVLVEHETEHMSAEEVFMLVKQKHPEIGLATVYRTLELLSELQVVEKMNFGDGAVRYDLRDSDHAHMHHHLICSVCGNKEEIKEDWLQELEMRLEREFGFAVTDHRLDFTGTYRTCGRNGCNRASQAAS